MDRTTSKLERLQEYLSAADLPDLTDAEEKEIDEVGSTVHHRAYVSFSPRYYRASSRAHTAHRPSGSTRSRIFEPGTMEL